MSKKSNIELVGRKINMDDLYSIDVETQNMMKLAMIKAIKVMMMVHHVKEKEVLLAKIDSFEKTFNIALMIIMKNHKYRAERVIFVVSLFKFDKEKLEMTGKCLGNVVFERSNSKFFTYSVDENGDFTLISSSKGNENIGNAIQDFFI
jgi:hypothetical protein